MGLSSSPRVFTEFTKFTIWAIKMDRPDLKFVNIDTSLINVENFISNADVYKTESEAIVATLFHYLDDILRGHPNKDKAWQQFNHSESILRKLSLQTKEAKAKPPA